jgi:hypothetical protein
MRRFRHKSGEVVGRLIETVRDYIQEQGIPAALQQASQMIPSRLRPVAFAVAVDLMLADAVLKVREALAGDILRIMLIKNAA